MGDYFQNFVIFDASRHEKLFYDKFEERRKQLQNFHLETPYMQMFTYIQILLKNSDNFDPLDQAEALKNITFQDFLEFDKVSTYFYKKLCK